MPRKLLLLFGLLISVTLDAQHYPFVHYTPKDGLINSRVRKAYQDSKGRMYFITFGGLSVYDGARFRNYTTQNGLSSDLVNDVLEVGDDSLLIAVNTASMNVLVKGKMKTLAFTNGTCPVINHLVKGNRGDIFAGTDNGLYRISGKEIKRLNAAYPAAIDSLYFLGEIAAKGDMLIFTTNDLRNRKGLFLFDTRENSITDALPDVYVQSLAQDRKGNTWVSTLTSIGELDSTAMQQGKLVLKPTSPNHQRHATSGQISFNLANEMMVATQDRGLVKITDQGRLVTISTPAGFSTAVQSVFVDRENILWLCHDGNGVYKLANSHLQSIRLSESGNQSGLGFVRSFGSEASWLKMNDGTWVTKGTHEQQSYITSPAPLYPLHYTAKNIYAFNRNELYISDWPLPAGQKHINFRKILSLPDTAGFGPEAVTDPYGNSIMFESRNILVMQGDRPIYNYPVEGYDLVQGLYINMQGRLWVVSRGNGLVVFSLHPAEPSRYLQKEKQYLAEFSKASPRCMAVDSREMIWVGTRYHGLMGFKMTNDSLILQVHLQTRDGLTDNFITSLACDIRDNVIIGTQTGLDRLVKTEDGYRLENITRSNNIFSFITHVWSDAAGDAFAFSNSQTILKLESAAQNVAAASPHLLLEEFKVNGKIFSAHSAVPQLRYFEKNINVSVSAPTFIDETQVKFSYMLEGTGDDRWSDTLPVADFSLLNLSPGDYRLHVKAFFPSTAYQPQTIVFPFVIHPPWWSTWWFRLIAAAAFAMSLLAVIRVYYQGKLRSQRTVLERKQAIEKERTRIATDMHDDLGAGLSRIKFLSETIGIKQQQHQPIQEDIGKIREYSHEMIDKMGEIVWALNEKNDSLSDLLSYARSYAVEYLSQNRVDCVVELPDDPPVRVVSGELRRNVFLSVKEILHNTVKHAQASKVRIHIAVGSSLNIRVSDDGIGFDASAIRQFSNGISNIRKRMNDMGGSMQICGNGGTIVELDIPLP